MKMYDEYHFLIVEVFVLKKLWVLKSGTLVANYLFNEK